MVGDPWCCQFGEHCAVYVYVVDVEREVLVFVRVLVVDEWDVDCE